VRADRLVSLVLLLQARGRTTAASLARELEVSVRTIYRDMEALSAAGVPVVAEAGPRGGCRLLAGYRFPLRGLRPHEAEALLILGVPGALRDLGVGDAATSAHRQIQVTAGLPGTSGSADKLVHLDMPRWFHGQEKVSSLRTLAEALRLHRHLTLGYPRSASKVNPDRTPGAKPEAKPATRIVGPLGLVNKAGIWYLVATTASRPEAVFRVGRITFAQVLAEPFERPAGFDLAEFWDRWSAEFASTRPQLAVRVRASPEMLGVLSEIFGESVHEAIAAALPPDEQGWRELTLSFEHELAAAHRLAGFGDQVEVLSPASVREKLLATGRAIVRRYGAA
jgi:predicted DNA-binding transcriptional regulator YafY